MVREGLLKEARQELYQQSQRRRKERQCSKTKIQKREKIRWCKAAGYTVLKR